jgi:threonine synthase
MIRYVSTRGGIAPVDFSEAVLQGFAADGGLFVPEVIPRVNDETLEKWSCLSYPELAHEILSLFIDPAIIPAHDLKKLIDKSFSTFDHPDLMPLVSPGMGDSFYIMELFHGPTLSFKDIAMGFLINTMDYLLAKRDQHLSVILATTGDTGPAAAYASAGKKTIDCWPLYPLGMISEEQQRQMTTLDADNVLPVGVKHCKDGGDYLDLVIARLFKDHALKKELGLSSVNSINWCRVLVQAVHFGYGYFRARETSAHPIVFSVPSGAFGNLFAGFLAKQIGIPIHRFICANNRNTTLHTVFSDGIFQKKDLVETVSSAIDIVVPYNFWRYLYFVAGGNYHMIRNWMDEFSANGVIHFDRELTSLMSKGYFSCSISDEQTLATIRTTWENFGYLLDPHTSVAVGGAHLFKKQFVGQSTIICMATAHPAKFPEVIKKALVTENLPAAASHPSLLAAKLCEQKGVEFDNMTLETDLITALRDRKKSRRK